MITQETASRIWKAYREIATARRLLADMKKQHDDDPYDPHAEELSDAFGRRRELQLGVPSGENCHRLFDVSPTLAKSVIVAHIAAKQAELVEANEQAKIEYDLGMPQDTESEVD